MQHILKIAKHFGVNAGQVAIDQDSGFATSLNGKACHGWTVTVRGKAFDVWTAGNGAVLLVLPS